MITLKFDNYQDSTHVYHHGKTDRNLGTKDILPTFGPVSVVLERDDDEVYQNLEV